MAETIRNVTRIKGPPVLAECSRFLIKLAETPEEIAGAQQLRYDVFKLEQGRMPGFTGCVTDADRYDELCVHLLVVEKSSGRIVGTYRICDGAVAKAAGGFYSDGEFEISGLAPLADRVFELGRSCVAPEFRSGAVVGLLWAGVAAVYRRRKFDYMIGCVSLEHTNCAIGWAVYRELVGRNLVTDQVHAVPLPDFRLEDVPAAELAPADLNREFPPLLKGYLRIGAKICGLPALDRKFGSIDFPIWFDFLNLPEKYARHFNV